MFRPCQEIGFYPIVDRAYWVEKFLPLGVKTIQLRIKNLIGESLEQEIKRSVELASYYNCQLFVNDYWDLAIKYNAFGVHLGQEDIEKANLDTICKHNLYLGISTHCKAEVDKALSINPSYIAIGPIFPTNSKKMNFVPQEIAGFKSWRAKINYPLVAIGGLTIENSSELIVAGANGIAVISDVLANPDPENRAREWIAVFEKAV